MIVCEYMALAINNHACPEALRLPLKLPGSFRNAEEVAEKRVVFKGERGCCHFLLPGHFDVDHGRDILFCYLHNSGAQV